jgi:hypothetical protein
LNIIATGISYLVPQSFVNFPVENETFFILIYFPQIEASHYLRCTLGT